MYEAIDVLKSMKEVYGVTPVMIHCASFISVLDKAGHENKSAVLLEGLSLPANVESWTSLVSNYKAYVNRENVLDHQLVVDYDWISDIFVNDL